MDIEDIPSPAAQGCAGDAARLLASRTESRVNVRNWLKSEVIPYIRSKGGLATLYDVSKHVGKDPATLAELVNNMPKTIYRYKTYSGNVHYLGMFDYHLTKSECETLGRVNGDGL